MDKSMNNIMDTSKFRVWHKVTAVFTMFFMMFSITAPAVANTLLASEIEKILRYSPELTTSNGGDYQYIEVPQLNTDTQSGYYSAEDFYTRIHPSVSDPYKYVGSKYAQVRLIRAQVYRLLGRQLIDAQLPGYENEASQIRSLYDEAAAFQSQGHSFGEVLTMSTESAPRDMIWPELRVINGESVIVPVLYLTQATYLSRVVDGTTAEFGGNVNFGSLNIEDVSIKFGRNSFISLAGNFNATNSQIESSGDLEILAGGDVSLLSTLVNAEGDLTIGASSIELGTIVHRYDLGGNTGTTYGQLTTVQSGGDISFESRGDITVLGSLVEANQGKITFLSDGNILIGSIPISSSFSGRDGQWVVDRSDLTFLQSSLSAEDNIELMARGAITLDAAEIVSSQGAIKILAGLGITIIDALGQSQETAHGRFGKKTIDTSVYQTVAIRSLLDAGKGIQLSTEYGNINLRAVDITSEGGTQVKAKNGGVNLLMTTETDHYSYSSVNKDAFTITTRQRGHNIQTGVMNTVVGGLTVEALSGVTVEYEGDPNLSENEQIALLSQSEGMQWLADIHNDPEVSAEFNSIILEFKTWSETNRSLSPAAMAVIAIAVAVATSGAGAAALGVTGTGAGSLALGAAANAAFTSIVTTAVSSLAAGNSLSATLDTLGSDENLEALAISMVTAAALSGVDSAFTNETTDQFEAAAATDGSQASVDAAKDGIKAGQDPFQASQTFNSQVSHAASRAAVSAGIDTLVNDGDFGDFETNFSRQLATVAIAEMGEYAANKIGESWDIEGQDGFDTAMKYVLHAGAGCVIGATTALNQNNQNEEDGCKYGALGGVTGEAVGSLWRDYTKEEVEKAQASMQKEVDASNDEINSLIESGVSEAEIKATYKHKLDTGGYQKQIDQMRKDGVNLARFSSALVAMLAGADGAGVNISATTGENAAENNALFLLAIPFIVKAIDVALTAYEIREALVELHQAYSVGGPEAGDQKLAEMIETWAKDKAFEKILEQLIPGGKIVGMTIEQIKTHISKGNGIDQLQMAVKNSDPRDPSLANAVDKELEIAKEKGEIPSDLDIPNYNSTQGIPGGVPIPDGFKLSESRDIKKHLTVGDANDGFDRKVGFSGKHDRDAFKETFEDRGGEITRKVQDPNNPDIISVKYRVYKQEKGKNTDELGAKEYNYKTLYNPEKYSADEIYDYGLEAAKLRYNDGLQEIASSGGETRWYESTYENITYRVYADPISGEITNFHPVVPNSDSLSDLGARDLDF